MMRRPADAAVADRIGRLYDRLGGVLYRHALMILADPAAAADAVHDVFVAVLGRDVAMDEAERYLHRAVRNECYGVLRRRRRRGIGSNAAGVPLLESIAAEPDRPDERLAVEQAIRALPPEQREVVHLKAFEGWTFQEIADLAGESINTVASRYRYALDKMRKQLDMER